MGRPKKNQETVSEFVPPTLSNEDVDFSNKVALASAKTMIENESLYNSEGYKKGIEFPKDEDGDIIWKDLIDPKYIVPNRDAFERREKSVPDSCEGLKDNEKLVLLAGYKKLASLRGYKSIKYIPLGFGYEEVSLSCEIVWRGTIDTDYQDVLFSSTANASIRNVRNTEYVDFSNFLTPLAENRSFVRNVRNFLNIPILGQDELGPQKDQKKKNGSTSDASTGINPGSPQWVLKNLLSEKGRNFEQLKSLISKKYLTDLELSLEEVLAWESISSISSSQLATKIIKIINNA